jgi:hypothetical protein
LEDECDRFFESGCTSNPIFKYENPRLAEKFRMQFQKPHSEYMDIAKKIIDEFMTEYGSESNWLERQGRIVSQEETEAAITDYL